MQCNVGVKGKGRLKVQWVSLHIWFDKSLYPALGSGYRRANNVNVALFSSLCNRYTEVIYVLE